MHFRTHGKVAFFTVTISTGILVQIYYIFGHYRFGQTLGKYLLKIKVVSLDGCGLTLVQSIQRNIVDIIMQTATIFAYIHFLAVASDDQLINITSKELNRAISVSLPVWYNETSRFYNWWYIASIITVLLNAKRRALHDFLGNTVVIVLVSSKLNTKMPTPKDLEKHMKRLKPF
jgi:uncharacterized RDD family membrane protein YckC